jgi:hypothetical protein
MHLLKKILSEADYDKVQSVTVDPTFVPPDNQVIPVYNVETGEVLKNLPLGKCYRVSRRKIRAWLAEDIDIQVNLSHLEKLLCADGDSVRQILPTLRARRRRNLCNRIL